VEEKIWTNRQGKKERGTNPKGRELWKTAFGRLKKIENTTRAKKGTVVVLSPPRGRLQEVAVAAVVSW